MRFSPKDPLEIVTLTFDFTKDLEIRNASGTVTGMKTITPGSASVAVAVVSGIDGDPNGLKNGAAAISGNEVLQSAKLGIHENDYEFLVGIDANTGEHFVLRWILPVRART